VSAPDRLYRVYAKQWIWATGGYVVNLPFPDNDRPGVIAARAVGRLLVDHGILAGDRVCIVEVPEVAADVTALAAALTTAGAEVTRLPLADVVGNARPELDDRGRHQGGQARLRSRRGRRHAAPASEGPAPAGLPRRARRSRRRVPGRRR